MATGFNSESWAKVAGLWYDLGKYRPPIQADTANAKTWLRKTHADIMKHFAPNVVKMKKKMKVVPLLGRLIC